MKKTIRILALAMVTVILTLALVSCGGPNSDPDKALDALKDNDYLAEKFDSKISLAFLTLAKIDNAEACVTGLNDDGDAICIIYFEDSKAANDEWEDVQKYADDEKDDAKDSDWVCKKSGKMIYFGTKEAVKAAK